MNTDLSLFIYRYPPLASSVEFLVNCPEKIETGVLSDQFAGLLDLTVLMPSDLHQLCVN